MRTKALLGLAVLAASALSVAAQNVYSLNVVGYVNVPIPAATGPNATYTAIGNPLKNGDNSVTTVIGIPPHAASVMTWTGTGFFENAYDPDLGWDNAAQVIAPGTGFFVKNPGTAFSITFVGEVLPGRQTNDCNALFNFVSSKVPVAGDLTTNPNLNFGNIPARDSLLFWSGAGWQEDINDPDLGWDFPPVVTVPQAFFLKQNPPAHNVQWVTIGFP